MQRPYFTLIYGHLSNSRHSSLKDKLHTKNQSFTD